MGASFRAWGVRAVGGVSSSLDAPAGRARCLSLAVSGPWIAAGCGGVARRDDAPPPRPTVTWSESVAPDPAGARSRASLGWRPRAPAAAVLLRRVAPLSRAGAPAERSLGTLQRPSPPLPSSSSVRDHGGHGAARGGRGAGEKSGHPACQRQPAAAGTVTALYEWLCICPPPPPQAEGVGRGRRGMSPSFVSSLHHRRPSRATLLFRPWAARFGGPCAPLRKGGQQPVGRRCEPAHPPPSDDTLRSSIERVKGDSPHGLTGALTRPTTSRPLSHRGHHIKVTTPHAGLLVTSKHKRRALTGGGGG